MHVISILNVAKQRKYTSHKYKEMYEVYAGKLETLCNVFEFDFTRCMRNTKYVKDDSSLNRLFGMLNAIKSFNKMVERTKGRRRTPAEQLDMANIEEMIRSYHDSLVA